MEKDISSLEHTRWRCQYHVVFAPKYRRLAIYGQIALRTRLEPKCNGQMGLYSAGIADHDYILPAGYELAAFVLWDKQKYFSERGEIKMAVFNFEKQIKNIIFRVYFS